MIIKTLRFQKRSEFYQSPSNDKNLKFSEPKLKNSEQISFQNSSLQSNPEKLFQSMINNTKIPSTKFRLKFQNFVSSPMNKRTNSNKKNKLVAFQNDYLKSLVNKEQIQEERKQNIKEKIKNKIKEQLSNLLNKHQIELATNSVREIRPKQEVELVKEQKNVSVRGNPISKHLKVSLSQKINNSGTHHIKRISQIVAKRSMPKQNILNQVPTSPSLILKKSRRSLSNAIKLHQAQTKINVRNIHSSLSQFRKEKTKKQDLIEPWDYVEQF